MTANQDGTSLTRDLGVRRSKFTQKRGDKWNLNQKWVYTPKTFSSKNEKSKSDEQSQESTEGQKQKTLMG